MRPFGIATATEMSADLYSFTPSSLHEALAAGTCFSATAQALMTKSLTDSLKAPLPSFGAPALTSSRTFSRRSISQSTVR